jgi:intracellular sulfur oxidation DsrE/DsrF family protein
LILGINFGSYNFSFKKNRQNRDNSVGSALLPSRVILGREMKKINLLFSTLLFVFFLTTAASVVIANGTQTTDINTILGNIRGLVWKIFATLVVICFLVAGILYLMSQGDPQKMETAKKAFFWAVVGTAVGILAYSITDMMLTEIFRP